MPIDLFAEIPVTDDAAVLAWDERLVGSPPSFVPTEPAAESGPGQTDRRVAR